MSNYDVAAYIWPSYTGDDPRTRIFWPDGYGEWESVLAAKCYGPAHVWPRRPLWGFVNEADPRVMEAQIEAALAYGVNTFIYDWYWYDGRPFLEECLENGFLKASNNEKMKFYVMWADHDVTYLWDRRQAWKNLPGVLWKGAANESEFKEKIARIFIDKYFSRPNYYRIDDKPVLYIYNMKNFVETFGGFEQTAAAMEWFNEEARKAGFKGVHWQCQTHDGIRMPDGRWMKATEFVKLLPFDSVTNYNISHGREQMEYNTAVENAVNEWARNDTDFTIPYYPEMSIGWDNTARYGISRYNEILLNSSPANFRAALEKMKAYADSHNRNLVVINSWNEWTEGTYLEPDDINGYGYLEAVKEVFGK